VVRCDYTGGKQFGLDIDLVFNTSGNYYPASFNNFHYSREYLNFVLSLTKEGFPAIVPELAELEGALLLY
jgi:hypothetical protein